MTMTVGHLPDDLAAGQRWLEVETNRVVVVLPGTTGGRHWQHYEDEERAWHCCPEDFFVWGRFRFIG